MLDELQRLREDARLRELLQHYLAQTPDQRDAWLDRCMVLEGVEPPRLVELHGLLIAFGWLEQNSGHAADLMPGACRSLYRTTAAGRRALKQCFAADDTLTPAA